MKENMITNKRNRKKKGRKEGEKRDSKKHNTGKPRPRNLPLEARGGVGGEAEGYGSMRGRGAVVENHSVLSGAPAPTKINYHVAESFPHSRQPHGIYEGVCEYLWVKGSLLGKAEDVTRAYFT